MRRTNLTLETDQPEVIHVLIVDDQPENLLSMEAVLTSPDLKLVFARSGKEALRAILEYDFALILMDVQMPVMDGFETVSLIRQRERSRLTPIIFVTAINKSDRNIYQGYSFGAVDYVFKPFMPEILKGKVDVFVDLFRKSSEMRAISENLARTNRELEISSQILILDFQNALKRTGSLLDDLRRPGTDPARESSMNQSLGEEAERTRTISVWLQDLADASRGELVSKRVSLSVLCPEVIAGFRAETAESKINWAIQNLPDIWGDEKLIRIAIRHLLGNAVRFAQGLPFPMVEVGSFLDKKGIVIFVKNDGPGFEMASDEDLVETFQRIGSGALEGVGISLVVAQKIVRRHGGRLWGTTSPGKGTVVSFLLDPVPSTGAEGPQT